MSPSILEHVYSVVRCLSKEAKRRGFIPPGQHLITDELFKRYYYEAFAVTITRRPDVVPHMDRQKDHWEGRDMMGAMQFYGGDKKVLFQIGVFGYTQKCAGDYLD